MVSLRYPTLDLFIYDLRNTLGQEQEEVKKSNELFAQKVPSAIRDVIALDSQATAQFEAEFIDLLGTELVKNCSDVPLDYEGYFYPVRLSDTYGLLLDCSVSNKNTDSQPDCLPRLKNIINQQLQTQKFVPELTLQPDYQPGTLGQSWMISGFVPSDNTQPHEQIAQAWYQALDLPDTNWDEDLQGQGYFMGGSIFELWKYRLKVTQGLQVNEGEKPTPIKDLQDNYHVIIVIYPDSATFERAAELCLKEWMQLWCDRNKILWAYARSREIKLYLQQQFAEIQNYIKKFKSISENKLNLKELQQDLRNAQSLSSKYAIALEYFEYQKSTIVINIYNYQQKLVVINDQAGKLGKTELKLFNKFSDRASEKYLRQLEKDYANLEPGLKLLSIPTEFIRARVEVEQAERQGKFEKRVNDVGLSLAVSALVVSLSPLLPISLFPGELNIDSIVKGNPVVGSLIDLGVPPPLVPVTIALLVTLLSFAMVYLIIRALIKNQ